MAKMVVVQVKCDVCGAVVQEDASQSFVITTGEGGVFETDLCGAHANEFNKLLVGCRPVAKQRNKPGPKPKGTRKPTMVQSENITVSAPMKKGTSNRPRTMPCGEPGCDYMGPDLRSVNAHKSITHGIKGIHQK
jgi:hypothetical protein